jgi:hypothetical protein
MQITKQKIINIVQGDSKVHVHTHGHGDTCDLCVSQDYMTLTTTFLQQVVLWMVRSFDHKKYVCVLTGAEVHLNHPVL